jgi:hypothetical protein
VTVANYFCALGNSLLRVALILFGLVHTLPYLVAAYTDNGGFRLFLTDILDSLLYCIQPSEGQDTSPAGILFLGIFLPPPWVLTPGLSMLGPGYLLRMSPKNPVCGILTIPASGQQVQVQECVSWAQF